MCLERHVCGKASGQKHVDGPSVGACRPVMCEAWRSIRGLNGGCTYTCDVYLLKKIYITAIGTLNAMLDLQP